MLYTPFEMNNYPQLPTPPLSGSEGSRSPTSYTVLTTSTNHLNQANYGLESMDINDFRSNMYLQITEEPIEKFRFRYKSEMAGTHGSLNGLRSDKSRKVTFPTVKLINGTEPAIIRCSLFQSASNMQNSQPHAHRLVMKHGNDEIDDPHEKTVSIENDYTASFPGMGIIHTARKNVVDELLKKKRKLLEEEIMRREGMKRPLRTGEEVELNRDANEEAKSINLNIICLRFDAFKIINNIHVPLCAPVYSKMINNLKSALTGELKIVRIDRCTSPAIGGKEVYLLVEKVTKKNIKVKFFELDEDEEIWSAYATFNDIDVHHQYAIVIKTPAYRETTIDSERRVYIQLERPSDGATSQPREFTYYPDRTAKRKRARYDYSSSISLSSTELPTLITGYEGSGDNPQMLLNLEDFRPEDYKDAFSSHEFARILECTQSTQLDTPIRGISTKDANIITRTRLELVSLIKTDPPEAKIKQMMRHLLTNQVNNRQNNALHLACLYPDANNRKCLQLFLKLISILKESALLDFANSDGNTIMHIAVENCKEEDINVLTKLGANISKRNNQHDTPLHIAIGNGSYRGLLQSANVEKFINLENKHGYSALQLAIKENNLEAVKSLILTKADTSVKDRTNGDNILQIAIRQKCMDIVSFIIDKTQVDFLQKNYQGINSQELAASLEKCTETSAKIYVIIQNKLKEMGLFDPLAVKEEPDSDSDMEAEDIKEEIFTIEGLKEMYEKVNKFTPRYLQKISAIFDVNNKWKKLPPLLDLEYLLYTDLFKGKGSPTTSLLQVALGNSITLHQIRTAFESIEEYEAVDILDVMVKNNS